MAKSETTTQEFTLVRMEPEEVTVWIVGTTPLIMNRMSEKARQELLLPRGRLSASEKAGRLKHNPLEEFQSSLHKDKDGLFIPCGMFKGALSRAALDTEGTRRTEVGRLTSVKLPNPRLFGIPELLISVVRSADINRTPDIRSRAIFPRWCVQVTIAFLRPKMTARNVLALLHNAGFTCGVGDWRPEKGNGSFGQFRFTGDDNDLEVQDLVRHGDWQVQQAAIASPNFHDQDSQDLFDWFASEVSRRELDTKRGKKSAVQPTVSAGNGSDLNA